MCYKTTDETEKTEELNTERKKMGFKIDEDKTKEMRLNSKNQEYLTVSVLNNILVASFLREMGQVMKSIKEYRNQWCFFTTYSHKEIKATWELSEIENFRKKFEINVA